MGRKEELSLEIAMIEAAEVRAASLRPVHLMTPAELYDELVTDAANNLPTAITRWAQALKRIADERHVKPEVVMKAIDDQVAELRGGFHYLPGTDPTYKYGDTVDDNRRKDLQE
jgi:hypothetical protein